MCQKFDREGFASFACKNYNNIPASQTRITPVIPKRRAARTPLPCREATVLHDRK